MYQQTILIKKFKFILTRTLVVLSIFSLVNYAAIKVYAVYYPTDNITNPACAPGASGCYVSLLPDQTSKSGSLLFSNGTNPAWSNPSALTWDSVNGRLGIGTTNPGHKLTIGDGTGNNFLSIANSSTNIYIGQSGNTRFGYAGGTIGLLLQSATNIAMGIGTYGGDAPLVFGTNNIERMRISGTSGNIGIGTITPVSQFHIATSPTSSANYGTFSLGSGSFDGTTSGYFGTASSSNANGTSLAINEVSGYTGDLINAQIGGVSLLKSTVNSLQVQGSGSATVAQFTRTDSGEARLTVMGYRTSSIPAIQLIQNSFNGTDYTPIPSGQQIGRIFARGPKNSGGTYSSIMGAGIVFNSTETWNDSATGSKTSFSVTKTGTTSIYYPFVINNNSLDNIYIEGMDNTSATNALAIYNSSLTNLFTVRNDGNVGIGTATPAAKLHVKSASGVDSSFILDTTTADIAGSDAFISIREAGVEKWKIRNVGDDDDSLKIGTPSSNWVKLKRDTGNFGIGSNINPSYKLQVGDGTIVGIVSRFQNSTGTCDINPTSTALSCSSDRNLKTNITNINNNILSNITSLQPVTYNWISDTTGPTQTGFIAQDVEAIFPSLVSTDSTTNLKSLNYIGLIPYAIEGIKELDAKLSGIASLDVGNPNSVASLVKNFLANVDNQIGDVYAKIIHSDKVQTKELCSSSGNCLSEEQFNLMIEEFKNTHASPQNNTPIQNEIPPIVENPENNTSGNADTPVDVPIEILTE